MIKEWTLPQGWNWTCLEGIALKEKNAIVDGPFGSNLKTSDYVETGVPVLQGKNITHNEFKWFGIRYISDKKADELNRSSVKIGDILIVKIGSIGYSAELTELKGHDRAIIPANLAKVSVDETIVDKSYLLFWLRSLDAERHFKSIASKTAQPALSLTKIKSLPVPLPPLPIQKQIAAVLEKADTLRSQCQQMEQELNSLAQSVFLDMFGDPVTNPKEWPQKPSKELCKLITVGIVIKPSSYYVDAGIPALRSLNVRENYISNENFVYFDEKVHEQQLKKTHVYEGDVVIVRSGQPGRSSVIPKEFDGANAIDILITRPNSDLLNSFYFSFFLNSEGGRQLVLSNEKGQVQKHLNVGELSRALIPVPPIALQNEFEYSLNKLAVQMRLNKDLLTNCDQNFNSLMQRAFKGELELKDVA